MAASLLNVEVSLSAKSPHIIRLKWLDVMRLMCAAEIVGYHWLRATHVAGLLGPNSSTSLVTALWGDNGRGLGALPYAFLDQERTWSVHGVANDALGFAFGFGWEAVNVFILLSGLSLSLRFQPFESGFSLRGWYGHRAARILLPYYAAALPLIGLGIAFEIVMAGKPGILARFAAKIGTSLPDAGGWELLKHVILLDPTQRHWVVAFFSPAWWFLPAIMMGYFSFPLLYSVMMRLGTKITLLVALIISLTSYRLVQINVLLLNAWYFVILNELFSFILGMTLGLALRDIDYQGRVHSALGGAKALAAGFILFLAGNWFNLFHATYAAASPLYTSGMFLILAAISMRVAGAGALIRLTRHVDVFHLYLVHQPLAFPFAVLLGTVLGDWGVVLGFPLYFVCALLTTVLFGFGLRPLHERIAHCVERAKWRS